MKKNYGEIGFCPKCGTAVIYIDDETNGDKRLYYWDCPNCETSGIEEYSLHFEGNYIEEEK